MVVDEVVGGALIGSGLLLEVMLTLGAIELFMAFSSECSDEVPLCGAVTLGTAGTGVTGDSMLDVPTGGCSDAAGELT